MFGCLGYSRFTDTVRTFNQKRPLLAYKDYTNDMYICCLNQFGTFVLYYCLILQHRFVGYSLDLKVYWFLLLLNLEKNWNIFFSILFCDILYWQLTFLQDILRENTKVSNFWKIQLLCAVNFDRAKIALKMCVKTS